MILIAVLAVVGLALPHVLRLEQSGPATAAALWAVSLALRALIAIFLALYLAFFLPATHAFDSVTHWCWHTVLPVVAAHLGLDGHSLGDAATIVPGLVVIASLVSVSFGVYRAARTVRRLLARHSLGPGPANSVIVPGGDVMLAAAGLAHPRVVVSAGALLELDDEELAASLDHEHGHIARRHRFVLVFAELCRGVGRFIPGGRRAVRELAFHLERDADDWALKRSHDRLALASAICKSAGARPLDALAINPLSGAGTAARLGQLIEDPDSGRSRPTALVLNALAVTLVCTTVVTAGLIPSTALAGAQRLSATEQIHHC
jgi:hypothetical protein